MKYTILRSFTIKLMDRGKRTGSFWAIFMAGNILGNLCAYCIMRFLGLVGIEIDWFINVIIGYIVASCSTWMERIHFHYLFDFSMYVNRNH